jgi:integrative and conjugative element protein (TIGR02256 family)
MICLSDVARETIEQEARRSSDGRETGGILLGHDANGDDPLQITVAGQPGPRARRSAIRFLRDLDYSRRLADEAYDHDGSVWVGKWHTHPRGPAGPSRRDLRTYRELLLDKELAFEEFTAVIVTMDRSQLKMSLHGWILRLVPGCPERLQAVATEVRGSRPPTTEE